METVLRILRKIRPEVDFEQMTGLVTGDVLDSYDMIVLLDDLEAAFDIEIDAEEILAENFDSAQKIWALVQHHQSAKAKE